jgi:hypothetical protein
MADDPWFHFLLGAFATWRVAHLLAHEDGPWDLVAALRGAIGEGGLGRLLDCFYCVSLWVAAPVAFAVARGPVEWMLAWLALSGAASVIERLAPAPVARLETPLFRGDDDVLLRTETRGPRNGGDDAVVEAGRGDAADRAQPREETRPGVRAQAGTER